MTLPPKDSNDPFGTFFPLSDPQDILRSDIQVTPLLPRTRLESMIDRALSMPQHRPIVAKNGLPQITRHNRWSDRGRVSGVLAAVACGVLFFTVNPQTAPFLSGYSGSGGNIAVDTPQISSLYREGEGQDSSKTIDSEVFSNTADMNDLLLYDFLESL